MSSSALNELGFADFVAKLISDTFTAVLTSQSEQRQKLEELTQLANLKPDELITLFSNDSDILQQVEQQLREWFPANNEIGHEVHEGAKYQVPTVTKPEEPNYSERLQLELRKGEDYKAGKLTKVGVQSINRQMLLLLALEQQAAIKGLVAEGIPKLVVDGGKVNAKLTFSSSLIESDESVDEEGDANSSAAVPTSATNLEPTEIAGGLQASNVTSSRFASLSKRFTGVIDTRKLVKTRLNITPASNKAPQDAQTTANIYSEVEIHFKTIL